MLKYAGPMFKMLHENICLDSKKGPLESTHEVITRLKFISMVKRDEKINVKNNRRVGVYSPGMFLSSPLRFS
jgi:hypothetical protein